MEENNDLQLGAGLWVIAMPIGNPQDISVHALEVLKNCDLIAAEDTRSFQLFSKLHQLPKKQIISYHKDNEDTGTEFLIQKILTEQKSVALVSEAGTPQIQDPGHQIIKQCYSQKIPLFIAPGPSSVTAALSVCPIGGEGFLFWGFLPRVQSQRKGIFSELRTFPKRVIFFEAPHRLQEHLSDALEVWGDIPVFICRELTKKFQELNLSTVAQLVAHYEKQKPLGEFVLIYPSPAEYAEKSFDLESFKKEILAHVVEGKSFQEIYHIFKHSIPLSRKELYALMEEIKSRPSC